MYALFCDQLLFENEKSNIFLEIKQKYQSKYDQKSQLSLCALKVLSCTNEPFRYSNSFQ